MIFNLDINSLLSALVGGLLTLVGVTVTLLFDQRKQKKNREEAARPFFAIMDYFDERTHDSNKPTMCFSLDQNYDSKTASFWTIMINSDKVPFLIEKFTINGKNYYPDCKEMILKEMCVYIKVFYTDNIGDSDIIMHVIDINHRKRKYKMFHDGSRMNDFEELKK